MATQISGYCNFQLNNNHVSTHQIGSLQVLFRVRHELISLLPKLVDSFWLGNAKTVISEGLKIFQNINNIRLKDK